MPLSETRCLATPQHSAWVHAGEVAQWVLLLMGWLWLGEQGMRLGWSLASGVLAVSLWWAARLLCRGSEWALHARAWVMALCGGLSALCVWLPEALKNMDAVHLNLAHVGLLAAALIWGAWSGMVETRSRVSAFEIGPVAWHPILAALLVAGVGWAPVHSVSATLGVSALLAVCAVVLQVRDRTTAGAQRVCRAQRAGQSHVLAPSAMGLMMGGLWLGNVWCAGLGWTTQEMVLWHLAMMAGLPALVAWAVHVGASSLARRESSERLWHPRTSPERRTRGHDMRHCLSLVLLAWGALMLLGQSAFNGLLAMLLPSLAWAIHCSRPRTDWVQAAPVSAWWRRGLSLTLGPGLLLWVGMASPVHGPLGMQSAMALLGALAAVQALRAWLRQPLVSASWSTP